MIAAEKQDWIFLPNGKSARHKLPIVRCYTTNKRIGHLHACCKDENHYDISNERYVVKELKLIQFVMRSRLWPIKTVDWSRPDDCPDMLCSEPFPDCFCAGYLSATVIDYLCEALSLWLQLHSSVLARSDERQRRPTIKFKNTVTANDLHRCCNTVRPYLIANIPCSELIPNFILDTEPDAAQPAIGRSRDKSQQWSPSEDNTALKPCADAYRSSSPSSEYLSSLKLKRIIAARRQSTVP